MYTCRSFAAALIRTHTAATRWARWGAARRGNKQNKTLLKRSSKKLETGWFKFEVQLGRLLLPPPQLLLLSVDNLLLLLLSPLLLL